MLVVWISWFALKWITPASYSPRSVRYSDLEVIRLRDMAGISPNQQFPSYEHLKALEQIVHGHEAKKSLSVYNQSGALPDSAVG